MGHTVVPNTLNLHHDADEEEAECWVDVDLVLPLCQPHDQGGDDDDDGAQGVGQHVQEHAAHVHLEMQRIPLLPSKWHRNCITVRPVYSLRT